MIPEKAPPPTSKAEGGCPRLVVGPDGLGSARLHLALDMGHRAVELLSEFSDVVADAVEVGTESHGSLRGRRCLLDVGVVHPTEP